MKRHDFWKAPLCFVFVISWDVNSAVVPKVVSCSGVPTQMVVTVESRQDANGWSVSREGFGCR